MDAVVLALCSAALFGGMTVALRPALARGGDPLVGALLTVLPALGVALVAAAIAGDWDVAAVWPFALAGMLGPGRLPGPVHARDPRRRARRVRRRRSGWRRSSRSRSRPSCSASRSVAGIALGAVLIVGGGVLLASETGRPEHVRTIGLVFALAGALAFAFRDTFVRWLAVDADVAPELAISATLLAGAVTILVALRRRPPPARASRRCRLPAGRADVRALVRVLYEAFFRGPLNVVSPLVATESLWGVGLSALFLRAHRGVGRRLVLGAVLVVAGGVLIGVFR